MSATTAKVIMVTGASAGVGRAIVRRFAGSGIAIGLIARGADGLAGAEADVHEAGGRAHRYAIDVADHVAVDSAAADLEARFGELDLWINNAMASVFSPVHEMQPEEFRRVTEVTYLGVVNGTLAALRRMRPRNRGLIIQVGSALAYRGIPLQSAYCAAKHAIQGFTESLRCELLHDRSAVRVGIVHLPAVNTPQFGWVKSRLPRRAKPVPPIYEPELIADAIHYAARHRSREIHLGFSTELAIVANKLAPALLDRYLARTGYDSQQTAEPEDPRRPDNLWRPVPGDHRARGSFSALARTSSWEWWLVRNRLAILVAVAVIAVAWVAWERLR
jgi:NAD(P)-dependent dehydrogenase (short-subunit alcohol dehydrogenase family)